MYLVSIIESLRYYRFVYSSLRQGRNGKNAVLLVMCLKEIVPLLAILSRSASQSWHLLFLSFVFMNKIGFFAFFLWQVNWLINWFSSQTGGGETTIVSCWHKGRVRLRLQLLWLVLACIICKWNSIGAELRLINGQLESHQRPWRTGNELQRQKQQNCLILHIWNLHETMCVTTEFSWKYISPSYCQ